MFEMKVHVVNTYFLSMFLGTEWSGGVDANDGSNYSV